MTNTPYGPTASANSGPLSSETPASGGKKVGSWLIDVIFISALPIILVAIAEIGYMLSNASKPGALYFILWVAAVVIFLILLLAVIGLRAAKGTSPGMGAVGIRTIKQATGKLTIDKRASNSNQAAGAGSYDQHSAGFGQAPNQFGQNSAEGFQQSAPAFGQASANNPVPQGGYDQQASFGQPSAGQAPQYGEPSAQQAPQWGAQDQQASQWGAQDQQAPQWDAQDQQAQQFSAPAAGGSFAVGAAPAVGQGSAAPAYGDQSAAPAYGDQSEAPASGDQSAAPAFGEQDHGQGASTTGESHIDAAHDDSAAVAAGHGVSVSDDSDALSAEPADATASGTFGEAPADAPAQEQAAPALNAEHQSEELTDGAEEQSSAQAEQDSAAAGVGVSVSSDDSALTASPEDENTTEDAAAVSDDSVGQRLDQSTEAAGDNVVVGHADTAQQDEDDDATRLVAAPAAQQATSSDDDATELMARIRLRFDNGEEHTLAPRTLVGRNPQASGGESVIAVQDESRSMSKTHALIENNQHGIVVTDLGSTNGTSVTDVDGTVYPVPANQPTILPDGWTLQLGDRDVTVEKNA